MKRSILVFFCMGCLLAAVSARAQVVPAATSGGLHLSAGGEGSVYQPDYANEVEAYPSPNRLYGIGAFVDARFNRWAQIEAEGRWMQFNKTYVCAVANGQNIDCQNGENTYSIGPRIAPYTFHKFTPYGKVLAGLGNGSFLSGNTFVLSYGGGVDYRLNRRFTLRCFDFEYQQWFIPGVTLYPYGGSVGLSYRIF